MNIEKIIKSELQIEENFDYHKLYIVDIKDIELFEDDI